MATPGNFRAITTLKNRVFLVRHGLAESNVQGILVSDPKDGVPGFGLVDEGRKQAKEAATELEAILKESDSTVDLTEKIYFISSDFKRTMETAQIIHEHFKVKAPIETEPLLRERGFGDLHFTSVKEALPRVLEQDLKDPTQGAAGGESVSEMVVRVTRVLQRVDDEFSDRIVVLVSHGDPLQVFWAICKGVPPHERFQLLKGFRNCTVREFKFEN